MSRAMLKRLLARLWANRAGQSVVEYLIVVGACALVGILGFARYGKAVKGGLAADAKHIEGEGLLQTENILSAIGADYNEVPGWCVKPNYCFAAGTPVHTDSGDRAIESIRIGDRIWARDVTSGAVALRPVVNTFRTPHVPVVDLELSSPFGPRERLAVTRSHLFWVEGAGWLRADALSAQPLWSTESQLTADIVAEHSESTTVFNLEVAEFHSYFVGQSHVLVHNGDPSSSACPEIAAEETPDAEETRDVKCGESGRYKADLGGGSASTAVHRPSPGLQRDHVPSGKALKARAVQLMNVLADRMMKGACRDLTEDEMRVLEVAVTKAQQKLEAAAEDNGFTIAEPTTLHRKTRTWGSKNKPLYGDDSLDLQRAALEDSNEIRKLIASGKFDDKLPGDCKKDILAALDKITGKTQAEYDEELRTLARAELEKSGYIDTLESTCEGH